MKFTKYFLSLAAAVGMIAGCQKPEMIQISAPEDVVAPVLTLATWGEVVVLEE